MTSSLSVSSVDVRRLAVASSSDGLVAEILSMAATEGDETLHHYDIIQFDMYILPCMPVFVDHMLIDKTYSSCTNNKCEIMISKTQQPFSQKKNSENPTMVCHGCP